MSSPPAYAALNREPAASAGDLFLSYNSKDLAAVQGVRTLLQRRASRPLSTGRA